MKKLSAVLLATLLLLASVSCTPSTQESDVDDKERVNIRETEAEEIAVEKETSTEPKITTPTTTTTTTTTTSKKKTTTTTAPPFGSRKNPASFGTGVGVSGTEWDGSDFEYVITLTNLRRGVEAEELVMSYNMFNEIPTGQEAIVFDVEFELVKYDQKDDDSYYISKYNFQYYTPSFTSFDGEALVGSDNEFRGELYEGGVVMGDVAMCISEGDQGYLLYDDFVWFELP